MNSQFLLNISHLGNPIRKLKNGKKLPFPKPRLTGYKSIDARSLRSIPNKVIKSWKNKFSFNESSDNSNGLRSPQIGALHAILAHWKVSQQPATIVIPTGLGKTETMLAVTVSQQLNKILILVPTDALRDQITDKFLTLGILKKIEVLRETADLPVVGTMLHSFKTADQAIEFFSYCNVVVATMSVINNCSEEVQRVLAQEVNCLFIDEAHHVTAPTWKKFVKLFKNKPILQFTATPYRNDGKLVEGKIIFNFPLKLAQKLGYFRTINYDPVLEYDPKKVDMAIANKAVLKLKQDIKNGYDHILMARVSNTKRATEVFEIYKKYTEFNPVEIHTGIKPKSQLEKIRQNIIEKKSKIIVCVDMLGEGFDLPELKIAAFHDIRKSLPVTLQLVGRFTRSRDDLGDPTFIANAASIDVADELKELYSQNSDWNSLLSRKSEKITQEQIDLWDFLEGFDNLPTDIPMQNIQPAMSTVVYKTEAKQWKPDDWEKGFKGIKLDKKIHDVNHNNNTLVIITAKKTSIGWGDIKEIYDWNWILYIIHWNPEQQLLFIHSSSNQGKFQSIAKAIAGENTQLIDGPQVFKCFSGIKRLMLQSVGLREQLGKLISYTMRSGSDVEKGMSEADKRSVKKALIIGAGYENGGKTSLGCSYKGRIWSKRKSNIEHLVKWFALIGSKLLNQDIDANEVLRGTLVPTAINERPAKMPITIDWPEEMYMSSESIFDLIINDREIPLFDVDISLINPSEIGDIVFKIGNNDISVKYKLTLQDNNYKFEILGDHTALIRIRNNTIPLSDYFYENTPRIWFYDNSVLEGNSYTELKSPYPPYDSNKIEVWDWQGVDIRKESQGLDFDNSSIQFKLIDYLISQDYDIIFDDDGSGEIGDVIAIKDNENSIEVEIYHCKYSSESKPGGRVKDLYEVCGQAQKCVSWLERVEDMFSHMQRRDVIRLANQNPSRFMKGNLELVSTLQTKILRCPVKVSIIIVQPGLSVAAISDSQLNLLSVTENYLMDTYKIPFNVIANA